MVRRERNKEKEKHHGIRWTRSETESVGNTELHHVHILCTRSADP